MVDDSTVSCYSDHSGDYDVYQSAVVPHYQEMLDMVALSCSRYLSQTGSSPRILDLGCGTGNASMTVLDKVPAKIFLVDGSCKMVDIALEKISSRFPSAIAGHKVADLSGSNWSNDLGSREYDAIVSTLLSWNTCPLTSIGPYWKSATTSWSQAAGSSLWRGTRRKTATCWSGLTSRWKRDERSWTQGCPLSWQR